jgi:hypothetical protein
MMTESDFAAKVEWEGGVIDALEYGLLPGDVEPGQLHDAWAALYAKYQDFKPLLYRVEGLVENASEETG